MPRRAAQLALLPPAQARARKVAAIKTLPFLVAESWDELRAVLAPYRPCLVAPPGCGGNASAARALDALQRRALAWWRETRAWYQDEFAAALQPDARPRERAALARSRHGAAELPLLSA